MSESVTSENRVWRCEDCHQSNDEHLRNCDFCGSPRPSMWPSQRVESNIGYVGGGKIGYIK